MADWHVSGSESDGEGAGDGGVMVGDLRIPPQRLAELLKTIETRKTLELECLAGGYAGAAAGSRETRRKHKRHKRKAESPNAGEDSRAAQEDVSETASELRSSASTDTGEGKWNEVSQFDYFHEDSASLELPQHRRQRKLPPGSRDKKLASLDQIMADVKQQRERQADLSTTPEITLTYHNPHTLHPAPHTHNSTHNFKIASRPTSSNSVPPIFDFDDDSDRDSPTETDNIKMSVVSQINRVEKLLDDEGFT